jgi:DNA-directed RNA polymerase specialized sigma24 family protein
MLGELGSDAELSRLRAKLVHLAMRRGLRAADAEDVAQSSLAAYLEVRGRYDRDQNHAAILFGILQNKCLEFFDRARREKEALARCASIPDVAREHPLIVLDGKTGASAGALEEILSREAGQQILEALAKLPEAMRQTILRLAEVGRAGVVARSGENKNTVDTRIHVARQRFRKLLVQRGFAP